MILVIKRDSEGDYSISTFRDRKASANYIANLKLSGMTMHTGGSFEEDGLSLDEFLIVEGQISLPTFETLVKWPEA